MNQKRESDTSRQYLLSNEIDLLKNRPSPGNLCKFPNFFNLFLIILSWTFTFNILTELCSVWDIALGFCSVSELCMDIGVDLLEHPYLGRLWHCRNTHLNASIQQNAKASAFIQASPLAGYHLYNKITVYSENIPLVFYMKISLNNLSFSNL